MIRLSNRSTIVTHDFRTGNHYHSHIYNQDCSYLEYADCGLDVCSDQCKRSYMLPEHHIYCSGPCQSQASVSGPKADLLDILVVMSAIKP